MRTVKVSEGTQGLHQTSRTFLKPATGLRGSLPDTYTSVQGLFLRKTGMGSLRPPGTPTAPTLQQMVADSALACVCVWGVGFPVSTSLGCLSWAAPLSAPEHLLLGSGCPTACFCWPLGGILPILQPLREPEAEARREEREPSPELEQSASVWPGLHLPSLS